jgi:hypothetical protein
VNDLKDLLELALSDVPGRDARADPPRTWPGVASCCAGAASGWPAWPA